MAGLSKTPASQIPDPDRAHGGEGIVRCLQEELGLQKLIGRSPPFVEAVQRIQPMARCDATVLIRGETGSGKEVLARAIHYLSCRSLGPFVPVNCGAIPLELIENELFGHERAAYTGASTPQRGLIREAESGTLFLDEVDCLTPTAQIKLLRFLEDKEYRPLGSPKCLSADVRLIAATNADLAEKRRQGDLREDLYYRLDVLPLELPPLRDRHEDIPLLARHFLAAAADELGRPAPELTAEVLDALLHHDWPGNVRELKHVMERSVVFAEDRKQIRLCDAQLPAAPRPAEQPSFKQAKARVVEGFERSFIEDKLLVYDGNVSRAARAAGKDRRAFWELMRKHHIDAARFRVASG